MKTPAERSLVWPPCYSGWALYCAVISVFGLTGYYADLLRPHVPAWVAVGLLMAPVAVIVFIQWGELSDRLVAMAHMLAALWFMSLAVGMEVGILLGHRPEGTGLFRVFAHVGWTFAWAGILRRAWASAKGC